jgi:hypothetical protein
MDAEEIARRIKKEADKVVWWSMAFALVVGMIIGYDMANDDVVVIPLPTGQEI